MEQPGGRTPKSQLSGRQLWYVTITGIASIGIGLGALIYFSWGWLSKGASDPEFDVVVAVGVVLACMIGVIPGWWERRNLMDEAQARQRVRRAEDKLSDQLRSFTINVAEDVPTIGVGATVEIRDDEPVHPHNLPRVPASVEQLAIERRDDRLTLASLWDVTHGRMDLYHQIVTGQARRSFEAAQVAMGVGFVMLVVFAVLAADAKTTTAAISAGGLGAVGAAFAAYIGKTFIRSQESAASHLRVYFDQPLELSRYLAAERLLADAGDLTAEQRVAIVSSLVQSIATAGHDDKDAKPTGRQPRGRAPR
jgi:hypothetical protein